MPPKVPPKKSAPKKGKDAQDRPSGIYQDAQVPVWDDADIESESFGDLAANRMDSSLCFEEEPGKELTSATLGQWVASWTRPSAIFSPFKPMVVRPNVDYDPYSGPDDAPDHEKKAKLAAYRHVKVLKGVAPRTGPNRVTPPPRPRRTNHIADGAPNFVLALSSAIMAVAVLQHNVEQDHYLWELIYPQVMMCGYRYPAYNPTGKYVVKLFWQGVWRKVVIDDRLPCDAAGDCMFPMTEVKEIWPALLAKAMLRVLTPANEWRLFNDATWCLMTLMGGWVPQLLNPVTDTALALKSLRQVFMKDNKVTPTAVPSPHVSPRAPQPKGKKGPIPTTKGVTDDRAVDAPEDEPDRLFVVATTGNLKSIEQCYQVGLQPENCYVIYDAKPYQATTLLRLVSPHVSWKGSFSYIENPQTWTEELEEQLGFKALNRFQNENHWNDFWVTWEELTEYFQDIHVFRYIMTRKYTCAQHLTVADIMEETGPEFQKEEPFAKFLCMKAPLNSQVLMVLTGMKLPGEGTVVDSSTSASNAPQHTAAPPCTEVNIYLYDWKSASPVSYLCNMVAPPGHTNSTLIPIPKGDTTFKVEVRNLADETLFALLTPRDIVWSDELDICQNHLGLSVYLDAGTFPPHEPGEWNLWFKRHIYVKVSTAFVAQFSVLPPGSDISSLQAIPAADTKKKGAKQVNKGSPSHDEGKKKTHLFGGRLTSFVPVSAEQAEWEQKELELLSYISFVLIDCDSCQMIEGSANYMPLTLLEPNKNGHLLMAYGITPTAYPSGAFSLQVVSRAPLDRVEPRPFDHFLLKEGEYAINPSGQLCRYNLTSQEIIYLSLQIHVVTLGPLPAYTIVVQHNGETVFERKDTSGPCYIANLWLLPPENKAGASKYSLTITLDPAVADHILQVHHDKAVEMFQQRDTLDRAVDQLLGPAAPVRASSPPGGRHNARESRRSSTDGQSQSADAGRQQDNKGSRGKDKTPLMPEKPISRTWTPVLAENQIRYCIRFHASSARFSVDPDTSVQDELTVIKHKWCRTEETIVPKAKPSKGEPSLAEQAAIRAARAREARERFLISAVTTTTTPEPGFSKIALLPKGPKPTTASSDDAKSSGCRSPKAKSDDLQDGTFRRESETITLMQLMESNELKMAALREFRTELQRAERERKEKYWSERRAEEAVRGRNNSEEDVVQRLMDEAATKKTGAGGAKPMKKK